MTAAIAPSIFSPLPLAEGPALLNLLIVDDPQFATQFEQEFQRVLALAKNPPARKQPVDERTERQRKQ